MLTFARGMLMVLVGTFGVAGLAERAAAQKCLAPGFLVELLYSAPEIEHPSVVTCDDQGNLFVGEDPMDMRGPTTKEFDRVLRIEFGPDGKPRRKTVFCDQLSAVFGLVWHQGALYVMHAPHYSVFRDTNGDGVADERRDLAHGFGPPAGVYGFNDHIVTGTRLGLDGLVYVSVGDKGVPKAVGSDGSTITLEGGGVIRMRLDGSQLEVVTSGTRNHLDVAMDSLDNIFTYDNTDDGLGWWTRITHHVPTGYYGYPYDYLKRPERHLGRISEHGGGSPVGAACYREAAWPATYVDSPFFCEWGKQKVQRLKVKPRGATFEGELEDFLVAEPGSGPFRPLDLCFSPDGRHMYVADWNFDGWVNPAVRGRLFRVTYDGNEPASRAEPPRAPQPATAEQLVASLGHPAHAERTRAQFALAALADGSGEAAARRALGANNSTELAKIHAAWSLFLVAQSPTAGEARAALLAALGKAVESPREGKLRAQLARIAGQLRLAESADVLARAAQADPDPTVRLQAAIALGRLGEAPTKTAWRSVDAGQPGVVTPRVDEKSLESLATGSAKIARELTLSLADSDPTALHVKIQALRRVNAWDEVRATLDTPQRRESLAPAVVAALTGVYDPAAIRALREFALDARQPTLALAAAQALQEVSRRAAPYAQGWWGTQPARGEPARPKNQEWSETARVLTTLRDIVRGPAALPAQISVLQGWRRIADPEALTVLREVAQKSKSAELRSEAIQTLAALQDRESLPIFLEIARDGDQAEPLRAAAIRAVRVSAGPDAARKLFELASDPQMPAPLLATVYESLGATRDPEAAVGLELGLGHREPVVRSAAATALAQLSGSAAAPRLAKLLVDADAGVRKAIVQQLGALRNRDVIPALVAAAADAQQRFDVQVALAQMPDRRALALYLEGAASPNQDLRNASLAALVSLRAAIAPDILALHERKELPASARGPLQLVYSTPAPITKWHLLGVIPKQAKQQLPKFDLAAPPPRNESVRVGDRELKWKAIETRDPDGRVNPGQHVEGPREAAWVFAWAELNAESAGPRNLVVGSDDQLRVWVNGQQVYEFQGSRGWGKDQGTVTAQFRAGANQIWILCGNDSGPWDYSVAVSARDARFGFLFENAPPQLDIAAFREFAAKNAGNGERGKTIFHNEQGVGCVKCHAVGGKGGKVGPDLVGIATKYPREELIRSILEPSARIANGFDTGVVVTSEGKVLTGVLKLDSPEAVELTLPDGKTVRIPAAEIDEKSRSPVSTMPNGLKDGMSLQDFADIVAYLEGLK